MKFFFLILTWNILHDIYNRHTVFYYYLSHIFSLIIYCALAILCFLCTSVKLEVNFTACPGLLVAFQANNMAIKEATSMQIEGIVLKVAAWKPWIQIWLISRDSFIILILKNQPFLTTNNYEFILAYIIIMHDIRP